MTDRTANPGFAMHGWTGDEEKRRRLMAGAGAGLLCLAYWAVGGYIAGTAPSRLTFAAAMWIGAIANIASLVLLVLALRIRSTVGTILLVVLQVPMLVLWLGVAALLAAMSFATPT